jgi:hypothetical protein
MILSSIGVYATVNATGSAVAIASNSIARTRRNAKMLIRQGIFSPVDMAEFAEFAWECLWRNKATAN